MFTLSLQTAATHTNNVDENFTVLICITTCRNWIQVLYTVQRKTLAGENFGEFGKMIVIRQYFTQSNSTFTIVTNGSYCKFANVFLAKTLKQLIRKSSIPSKFCAIRQLCQYIAIFKGCDYSHGTVTKYFIAKVTETKKTEEKIHYHEKGLNPVPTDYKSRALPTTLTVAAAQTHLVLSL